MDVCLLWVLCVVRLRSLRRADHSSRGVLATVVRRCVWYGNLANKEALAHWGLLRQKLRITPQHCRTKTRFKVLSCAYIACRHQTNPR